MSFRRLNIGCGTRPLRGWLNVDLGASEADVKADALRLPFNSEVFGAVMASHVVEHLPTAPLRGRDPFFVFFDEIHRVLSRDGLCFIRAPHADGPCAFADPTHRRYLTEATFRYLYDPSLDPHYPRAPWTLLHAETTHAMPSKVRSRFGPLNRLLRAANLTQPDEIRLVLLRVA